MNKLIPHHKIKDRQSRLTQNIYKGNGTKKVQGDITIIQAKKNYSNNLWEELIGTMKNFMKIIDYRLRKSINYINHVITNQGADDLYVIIFFIFRRFISQLISVII